MKAVRVHTDEGQFSAVMGEPGRIYTPFVIVDFPVRKIRIANGDVKRYTTQLQFKGKDYPLKRAVSNMLRIGRKHGINKGAKALLMEARS